ncbi:polysaccharide pyruvyl transferase family protein [Paraburkholderia sp. MMS20-SJTR3]|uniref:Polysaccharide pyruvyl transferase family protein n=1 Tax=Paraburkholderia sejongensis TaxID=2886946 RepID=A0ABS8JZB0_9BURK|nr:polysaccharide pyruvyl transferase family protein [Paraburkholderia sp. MMS20-SJTR3]MCC8395247.1 polysaccharide pyruvyl transferase family protein [Paraburkholderia sp. MMS20-SJTR3]
MQELETHDPVVIFGAFDRHNFGDLLFAHIAAKLFERNELIFAGLARRDMRVYGGHIVESLAQLAAQWGHQRGNQRVHVVHAGGEILTCSDWEAAVMLLPADEAQRIIARLDRHSDERRAWAHARTGLDALLPYMVSRAMFPRSASVTYLAAGGVEFDRLDAGMRAEALTKLAQADAVSVRDVHTRNMLAAAGIGARLMPDPAVMVAELLGSRIRARSEQSGVAQLRSAFPDGYLAVQFSADFGDDRTLGALARELDRVSRESGLGIVFFQAGAAPWHDDPACYERIAAKMKSTDTAIFRSLDLWDICAVIASARAYAGSSLHGRIVAMAFGLPRVNLVHPAHARDTTKQCAFAASWEPAGVPGSVGIDALAEAIFVALASEPAMLARTASRLVACYRREFAPMREVMGLA